MYGIYSIILSVVILYSDAVMGATMVEKCPLDWSAVSLQPDLNFDEFTGVWFENQYYNPGDPATSPEKWENMLIRMTTDGPNTAKVEIVATKGLSNECFMYDSSGTMRLEADGENVSKMKFIYSAKGDRDAHIYVVSTDYRTFAVVIQCPWNNLQNNNCTSGTKIIILTRQKILINESKVRRLINDNLCRDYDNGLYLVRHEQDCSSSNNPGATWVTIILPLMLILYKSRISDER